MMDKKITKKRLDEILARPGIEKISYPGDFVSGKYGRIEYSIDERVVAFSLGDKYGNMTDAIHYEMTAW